MRGKVGWLTTAAGKFGITPAYAGKRMLQFRQGCRRWDHPRLCGEKVLHILSRNRQSGSPPPMRGKAAEPPVYGMYDRITPAYAGKRHYHVLLLVDDEDHPRLCGEKHGESYAMPCPMGSPPPMRGKGGNGCQDSGAVQDHPRLCGEKKYPYFCPTLLSGSPPPMRGKAPSRCRFLPCYGITPAYAGKRLQLLLCV